MILLILIGWRVAPTGVAKLPSPATLSIPLFVTPTVADRDTTAVNPALTTATFNASPEIPTAAPVAPPAPAKIFAAGKVIPL